MTVKIHVEPGLIPVENLTRSAFSPFGCVVENPLQWGVNAIAGSNSCFPPAVQANQGTALKYPGISPIGNEYAASSQPQQSKAVMSLFVCAPRHPRRVHSTSKLQSVLDLNIMERHPYTTQTFTPLGLDPNDTTTAYLVVIAPTLPPGDPHAGMPDTANVKAFVAKGSQAVTYGVGIWHAPMIVIGEREISFVVTQFMNGVADDDCQEVEFEAGSAGLCVILPDMGDGASGSGVPRAHKL
ncbi:Ureidoglycolate lyase [Ptychographa xylographoides]|nr:Ureidoglycolate lyase [Ptychographa xylographoides]